MAAGLIRAHVRDVAHEVRWLGNKQAHADFGVRVEETEVRMTVGLMDDVLEEVYGSSSRVKTRTDWLRALHAEKSDAATAPPEPPDN